VFAVERELCTAPETQEQLQGLIEERRPCSAVYHLADLVESGIRCAEPNGQERPASRKPVERGYLARLTRPSCHLCAPPVV